MRRAAAALAVAAAVLALLSPAAVGFVPPACPHSMRSVPCHVGHDVDRRGCGGEQRRRACRRELGAEGAVGGFRAQSAWRSRRYTELAVAAQVCVGVRRGGGERESLRTDTISTCAEGATWSMLLFVAQKAAWVWSTAAACHSIGEVLLLAHGRKFEKNSTRTLNSCCREPPRKGRPAQWIVEV